MGVRIDRDARVRRRLVRVEDGLYEEIKMVMIMVMVLG